MNDGESEKPGQQQDLDIVNFKQPYDYMDEALLPSIFFMIGFPSEEPPQQS